MSYALILSEIGEGRYSIQLDLGESHRLALIAASNAAIAKYTLSLATAENNLTSNEEFEQLLREDIVQAVEVIIAIQTNDPQMSSLEAKAAQQIYDIKYKQYLMVVEQNQPLRRTIKNLKISIKQAQQQYNTWFNFIALQTRNAWCVDFTEGASGYVGTVEINGESDLILLAPECRQPVLATDGLLTPREFQSPEQAFFNTAILPGWQKFLPTYRWGTLTAIDRDANTGAVTLAAASSSAQRLDVNQTSILTSVPFQYLFCDNQPFEVGDDVVVQFAGQNWASPTIIGFLDSPKPCGLLLTYTFRSDTINSDGFLPPIDDPDDPSIDKQYVAEGEDADEVTAATSSTLGLFYRGWYRASTFDAPDDYFSINHAFTQTNVTSPESWLAVYKKIGPRVRANYSVINDRTTVCPLLGLSLGLASNLDEIGEGSGLSGWRVDGMIPVSPSSPASTPYYISGIPGSLTARRYFGSATHSVDVVTTWTLTGSFSTDDPNILQKEYTIASQSHYSIPP